MTDPFQASTSRMSSSIDSHKVYSVVTVIPCTIYTGQNHTPQVFLLMETFRNFYFRHNFHLQEIDHPSGEHNLALTQNPITKIIPPPNIDDMIQHIRFVSSHIKNRIAATPTLQDFHHIPVTKNQGTLRFYIDFCKIPNLHAAIELLDDNQPLKQCLVQLEIFKKIR